MSIEPPSEYRALEVVLTPEGKDGGRALRFKMEDFCWYFYQHAIEEERAHNTLERGPRLLAIIKQVVWGATYVESLANLLLRELIRLSFSADEWRKKWEKREDRPVPKKIGLVGRLMKRPIPEINGFFERSRRVATLRNRLVHFKEEPVPLAPFHEEPGSRAFMIPLMEIEKALIYNDMKQFHEDVAELRRWLRETPKQLTLPQC